ncbi:methylenetetrahydrofolate reductase-domain-containing protein [Rhodocollybia butyracea]|uniref:Methylenetetrahydrofolate reductase-domain-containing protein n=1 Tax=Rhodocollybia butyracea TaxID=206335 RepID=A0A9P5PQJ8_9AGAR|nr:methylenetetrahydrofolate reductase-domain-containing protein [Rhodocollybia butyracea]
MKLVDKISSYSSSHPFYTFEFFPPRTDQGFENLLPRIVRMSNLNPLAISITWGAGGNTKDTSLNLAELTQSEYQLDTILHLTCTNMEKGMVDEALRAAKERGIQNILALRGDPPRGKEEWIATDPRFQHALDLVTYIRSHPEFSSHFCIGVAAYPEGHPDHLVDEETEMKLLKEKIDAGADFIITQVFYDEEKFISWVKQVRQRGITVPIIPGIMPIQTYQSFVRLTKLTGSIVPAQVMSDVDAIKHNDQLVKDYGVELAVRMIRRITTESNVSGVHFCTLNLEKSVQRVLETLKWIGHSPQVVPNKLIEEPVTSLPPSGTITPITASNTATLGLVNIPPTKTEVGSGELNKADSWDDFPNGRWGDFKSPAYGVQGPWGNNDAINPGTLSEWGNPQSLDDLTTVFLKYLLSESTTTPFSSDPILAESKLILPHLRKLTERGWWTVGSQPAADGVRSSDPVVGWGPPTGYVFQKSFVEFFCTTDDLRRIEQKVVEKGDGWVHYYAANSKGEYRTNVPEDGRNAVTWGVFAGQELIQTTIIEHQSFLAWKEEAFSIWSDWASFYRPNSPERNLLEGVHKDRWLINVIHHDYKQYEALWTFISDVV